jgi:CheY-like chemotaxis protein
MNRKQSNSGWVMTLLALGAVVGAGAAAARTNDMAAAMPGSVYAVALAEDRGGQRERVIEAVQKRFNAKVVRVTETTVNGRPALELRLLSDQRVWNLVVDATTGQILSGPDAHTGGRGRSGAARFTEGRPGRCRPRGRYGADGEEGLYAALEFPIDVAIIDLGLPKLSGLELIRRLRAAGKSYGVLVLTARDRWQDKVEGLSAGADDYLAKPFHIGELQARLAALLRRSSGWTTPLLHCDPVVLDTRAQAVAVRGNPVELTSFGYRLLEHLMLHAGEVISGRAY